MAEETNTAETAAPAPEQPVKKGKKFEVSVEGAENASAQPTTIKLQSPDPEDDQRADEARERMEGQPTAQARLEMEAGAKQLGILPGGAPHIARVQAEMEAGRARLAEHAGRQAMLDAKRAKTAPEEVQVAEATETNKDL